MNNSVGIKIKALRMQNRISQEELCGNHMSRVVLSRIENGKALPSLSQIVYISRRFNKSLDFFLSDNNLPNVEPTQYKCHHSVIGEMYQKANYSGIIKVLNNDEKRMLYKDDYNTDFYFGMSYFQLNVHYEAIKPLKRYINKFLKSDNDTQKKHVMYFITALNTLSKIMLKNKNYTKCESYLMLAKKHAYINNVDGSYLGFVIHNNISYIYLTELKYNEIIDLLENFMHVHKEVVYPDVVASMCLALNVAYYNIENYEMAIKYAKKAIDLYSYTENREDAGIAYLNYINALRYSSKIEEGYSILRVCLNEYSNCGNLYQRFLMQKLILEFNMDDYEQALKTAEIIETGRLSKRSKCDYYFMLGHIEFVNGNYKKSHEYLLKCQDLYVKNKYFNELFVLYSDLYEITKDNLYEEKAAECKNAPAKRKNILI